MAEDSRKQVMDFLGDRSRTELRFEHEQWTYILIRSPFDGNTDFFYLLSAYGKGDPHEMGGKAEYAGVYSHLIHRMYDVCYSIEKLIADPGGNRRRDVFLEISRIASDMVVRTVNGQPVKVTEDSLQPHHTREYFLTYQLEEEAYKHFLLRTKPVMKPVVPVESMTSEEFALAINDPERLAERYARHYVLKRAKGINQFLWEMPQIKAQIAQLEATPGEHHYRRAIKESIHDEKMVRIEIAKDGVPIECRIDASVLKRVDRGYYPTWNMDSRSRKEFCKVYGDQARLDPPDIVNISYGKKVLYTKTSVHLPNETEAMK